MDHVLIINRLRRHVRMAPEGYINLPKGARAGPSLMVRKLLGLSKADDTTLHYERNLLSWPL